MFELRKGILTIAVTCGLIISSSAAMAASLKDSVKDNRGNSVTSTNGNCVRTRWQEGVDPCAPPAPAPVVQKEEVVVSTTRTLQKEQRTVYFDFDKADITPASATKLDALVTAIKADKEVKAARIVGFADSFGSDEYNEKLSQRRAKAVNDYIVSRGYTNVSATEIRWLGKSVPITNCSDKKKRADKIACMAEDRRVEVEIDYYTK